MEHRFDRRLLVFVGALALVACAAEVAPGPTPLAEQARSRVYHYAGTAGASEVAHARAATGSETLRGSTELGTTGTRLLEAAALDAQGLLQQASIVIGSTAQGELQVVLDRGAGVARTERAGSAPVEWRVPTDAPWAYAPGGDGALSATPVAAWVALRAAQGSEVVRVIDPERQQSHLVLRDQLVVPTEQGTTVVLGNDGVDVDTGFIRELRLQRGSVTLSRVAAFDPGA